MTEPETRAALASVLKATALAAQIQRRLTIADAIGLGPIDVSAELAEGQRLLRHARVELGVAEARQRFRARYP